MLKLVRDEAVFIVAVVQAALVCAAAFGLHLSAEQIAALVGLFSAVLALVVRQVVSSPTTVANVATAAATRTAERLTDANVGGPGEITVVGENVVTGAVGEAVKAVGGLVGTLTNGKGE